MCPPEDAVHVYVHTAATKDITPGGYYARGIYAWDLITKGPTAELPMFARIVFVTYWDWFLRWITRGAILSGNVKLNLASNLLHVPRGALFPFLLASDLAHTCELIAQPQCNL